MAYLSEIRTNWRPLLAAFIGMGSGMSVVGTITSTIVPSLLQDTKWDRAEFAQVGGLAFFLAFIFPFIGRLTDVLGVRKTALIGQVGLPLAYLAYSRMGGAIGEYKLIFVLQSLFCVTTTATVYGRLAVQYADKARGLALAIVISGPALVGIVLGKWLNPFVEAHGWREAYVAMAIFAAVAGLICFLLIPKSADDTRGAGQPKRRASEDYPLIFRTPAFWVLLVAMVLCNLPQTLLQVQLKFLMEANGVSGLEASNMLAIAPLGMLAGRFAAGFALDRFTPYIVAFVTLAVPSLGLFIIASSYDSHAVLTFAVFCVGFAFGAEGDVVAFLVARQFGVAIYSSVMGLLTCVMSMSTAAGAVLLGVTMAKTGGKFDLFLTITGTSVLIGAALLLLLGRLKSPAASPA